MIPPRLGAVITETLGAPITGVRRLSGGDISAAARLDTGSGPVFAKWRADPPDLFEREAEGLAALADSDAPLVVPRPLAVGRAGAGLPGFLVLPLIEAGRRRHDFDALVGEGLAALHRATAPQFGFAHDTYCGATRQPNGWLDDWLTFYRDRRLAPLLRQASARRGLAGAERRLFDRLLSRLPDWLAIDPEPPALLHGDLWAGNLLVTRDGRPALIDPAAYYGHREAELGMMALFGGFGAGVYQAYEAARPLQPGWRDRLPLYTLYHVLNHYVLFGGGYGAQALAIARRYAG